MRLQCSISVGLVVTKLTLQTARWSMFLLGVTFVVLPELERNLTENTIVALTVTEVFRPANKNIEYKAMKVNRIFSVVFIRTKFVKTLVKVSNQPNLVINS